VPVPVLHLEVFLLGFHCQFLFEIVIGHVLKHRFRSSVLILELVGESFHFHYRKTGQKRHKFLKLILVHYVLLVFSFLVVVGDADELKEILALCVSTLE